MTLLRTTTLVRAYLPSSAMLMRLYRERYRPFDMPRVRVRVRVGVRVRVRATGCRPLLVNPPLQPYRNRCG